MTNGRSPAKIELPQGDVASRLIRRSFRSALSTIPFVGGLLVEVAEEVIPDDTIEDAQRWQTEVTQALNLLLGQINMAATHSPHAWGVSKVIWEADCDAKGRVSITEAAVFEALETAADHEIEEAIAELTQIGWIEGSTDPNSITNFGEFYAKAPLFCFLDPILLNSSPIDDARLIADLCLSRDESLIVSEIDEHFNWENRRLYPALWFMSENIIPDFCEKMYLADYPFANIRLGGAARSALRHFIASGSKAA